MSIVFRGNNAITAGITFSLCLATGWSAGYAAHETLSAQTSLSTESVTTSNQAASLSTTVGVCGPFIMVFIKLVTTGTADNEKATVLDLT